jgi:hypothetical protein
MTTWGSGVGAMMLYMSVVGPLAKSLEAEKFIAIFEQNVLPYLILLS